MRKKIAVADLRAGMFLDEMCGSWLDHPFWKTSFLLKDETDLNKLRNSPVKEVWIDISKGRDVDGAPPAVTAPTPTTPPPRSQPLAAPRPTSVTEEVQQAARICARAKKEVTQLFQEARMGQAINAEQIAPLVEEISNSVMRSPNALISLARLKTRDDYTYLHSVAVCALMVALGKQLGLDTAALREAGMAGLLHDLGKAVIPLEILNKPGRLTDAEFTVVRHHPTAGHDMLRQAGSVAELAMDVCLHHHERHDGAGYPHGLKGDQISLHARMGAVCDVYDAITSNRPYKSGWAPADSIRHMAQWARDGQFDNRVFQAFVKSVGIYPTGSLVKLQSGRLGVVLDQSESSLLTPLVKVFFSSRSNTYIVPEVIDLGQPGTSERIVSRELPEDWGIRNLDEMWTGIPDRRS